MKSRTSCFDWGEFFSSLVLWAAAALLFGRALLWLAETTVARSQIAHAAVVLGFGLAFLLADQRSSGAPAMRFGREALACYAAACVAALLGALFRAPMLMLPGFGLLGSALLLFVFGGGILRTALGFGLAFSGFTFLTLFFPFADWPLRLFAGNSAAWFLHLIGHPAKLGFMGEPPQLILVNAGRLFEVAPECNGFGIISGCILLAILLVFARRLRVLDKLTVLLLAPLLGLFSNALRIVLIVVLAPRAGDNYQVLHEVVGITLFYGTLGLLWWLVMGLPQRAQRKSAIS